MTRAEEASGLVQPAADRLEQCCECFELLLGEVTEDPVAGELDMRGSGAQPGEAAFGAVFRWAGGRGILHRTGASGDARREETPMSFQAYLDTIEERTGLTPRALLERAKERGYDDPAVKAGVILEWLKTDYDLGRGHGMALVHVIRKGPVIDAKHVGAEGSHRDESDTLWLDGKATRPA